uniref:NHLP bacteriocin system secretion protein n=1 Tax=uncultured Thiotrichaceae bacterium TaxID=298394 RepID=A0A6S6S4H7_9GAMM|nr:MAG: NHLP bacteriocin system secretion protein [uncultured Thiotrichaceae bacterium]
MSTGNQQRSIFRKSALDRLSSPDQLDQLVTITDAKGWLALITLALILLSVIIWSLTGSIPTNVQGEGILISQDGQVSDAMAPAAGTLSKISVDLNTRVKKGQIVARLRQPAIEQQLKNLQEVVLENKAEIERLTQTFDKKLRVKKTNANQRGAAINRRIESAREQINAYRYTLSLQKKPVEETINRSPFNQTQRQLNTLRQTISDSEYELLRMDSEMIDLLSVRDQSLSAANLALKSAQRRVRELSAQLTRHSTVVAPSDGLVTEVKQTEGSIVQLGQSILSIESFGEHLQALVYIPTEHGKKVSIGMAVRIEPVTVKKEEYGSLLGEVASISNFPVSAQGIATVLRNQALAASFAKDGAPYAARVNLFTDPSVSSGYRWSSNAGPPILITSGTTLKARITVREQRPISLVMPFMKNTASAY